MITSITVDPLGAFSKDLERRFNRVQDLRIPLELIRESWFKSNRAIFALRGPGKFADLTPNYKRQKQKDVGFVYPILMRTGRLRAALTVPGNPSSISRLVGTKSLELGVDPSDDIFRYLHYGTSKMKARPYVLLGSEQVSPPEINRRKEAWIKLLVDYVMQVTGATNG